MKALSIFCIGCTVGWVIELLFRRFISKENRERKWINPGFLTGPWLPLYGAGLCALYFLSDLSDILPFGEPWSTIIIVLIMAVCMTAIEFTAGIIAINAFKVQLWDYSNERGNIGGLICPRFSLIWATLGAFYYFCLHSKLKEVVLWMQKKPLSYMIVGFYLGIFAVDAIYSANLLVKIKKFAKENEIVVKYSRFRHIATDILEERRKRRRFFKAVFSDIVLTNGLKNYLEWIKNGASIAKEAIKEATQNNHLA